MGTNIEPIELATTAERLVGRFRIVRPTHLAAHTPRPQALSDSLVSIQLHESALTNLLAGIELDGRTLTVPELQAHLKEKFPRLELQSNPEAERTKIRFADEAALVVRMTEGELQLQVAVAELTHRGRTQRNFVMHMHFKPQVSGLTLQLVHSGGPYFAGELRNAERLRLQGIFGKVIEEGSVYEIVTADASSDKRFNGLMFTQMLIDDGWLAAAVGPAPPERQAQQTRSVIRR